MAGGSRGAFRSYSGDLRGSCKSISVTPVSCRPTPVAEASCGRKKFKRCAARRCPFNPSKWNPSIRMRRSSARPAYTSSELARQGNTSRSARLPLKDGELDDGPTSMRARHGSLPGALPPLGHSHVPVGGPEWDPVPFLRGLHRSGRGGRSPASSNDPSHSRVVLHCGLPCLYRSRFLRPATGGALGRRADGHDPVGGRATNGQCGRGTRPSPDQVRPVPFSQAGLPVPQARRGVATDCGPDAGERPRAHERVPGRFHRGLSCKRIGSGDLR